MAIKYFEAKTVLDAAAVDINGNAEKLTQARGMIGGVVTRLAELQTKYSAQFSEIAAEAAAAPNDDAWKIANIERQKLVAEFQSLSAEAQAQADALDAL